MKPLHIAGAVLLIMAVPASVLGFSLASNSAERGPVARIALGDIPQARRALPAVQQPAFVETYQTADDSTKTSEQTSAPPSRLGETRRTAAGGIRSTAPSRAMRRTVPALPQGQDENSGSETSALVLPEATARPVAPAVNRSSAPSAQPMRLPPVPREERPANLSQPQTESPQEGSQGEPVQPGLSSDTRDARKALRDIRPR